MNISSGNNRLKSKNVSGKDFLSAEHLKQYLVENKLLSISISNKAYDQKEPLFELTKIVREQSYLNPNLGIALTMHHHIVMVLAKYKNMFSNSLDILEKVLKKEYLVASAFSEGRSGINIFEPSSIVEEKNNLLYLSGYKRPCTLSSIADHYVLSAGKNKSLTLLSIPSKKKNISIKSFWVSEVFKFCDNNEIAFSNVLIEKDEITSLEGDDLNTCLIYGLAQFNLLASSAYIGIADRILALFPNRLRNIQNLETKTIEYQNVNNVLLEQMTNICSSSNISESNLNSILTLRYLIEDNLKNINNFIFESSGGIDIITNPDFLILSNHLEMFKYHPTSKSQFYRGFLENN